MENNSDLNNQSPIHIVLQHPMPESRKLPAAQYDTIHHGAKTSGCPSSTPSAIRRQGRKCPHFPQQQENTAAWGFKKLYDDMARISRAIHLNDGIATRMPKQRISVCPWKEWRSPQSGKHIFRVRHSRPITALYATRSWDLLPKQQNNMNL